MVGELCLGTIKVIGRNEGKDVAVQQHITALKPAKLILKAEKKEILYDPEQVVYVTATVVDKNGIRFPNSKHKVKFSISGTGEIVAVDNSNPISHEMYKSDERTVYKGKAIAIIRAKPVSGTIRLTASAPGLGSASTEIKVKK